MAFATAQAPIGPGIVPIDHFALTSATVTLNMHSMLRRRTITAAALTRSRIRAGARLAYVASAALALLFPMALPTVAQAESRGYFGGLRLDASAQTLRFSAPGLRLGQGLEFGPAPEPSAIGSTAFGGYQFESGVSIAASLSTLQGLGNAPRGVGLQLDANRWAGAVRQGHQVNVDVVSAFNWTSAVSVYGRFGVGRGDLRTADPLSPVATGLDRTTMRYGVGVRYDFSPSLGLKLEMSRGVKSPWERVRVEPEGDSINFGLRWVF